jgi:hypothetical protein
VHRLRLRVRPGDTRGDVLLVYETRPELEQAASVPLPVGSPYGTAIDRLWVTLTAENRLLQFDLKGGAPRKVAATRPSGSRTAWP